MTDSPRDDLESLPEGIEALRALVLRTIADRDATLVERDAAVTERDILLAQNDRLRHLLLQLKRMHFGARSERLPEEQLQLGLEALEQAIAKENAEAEKRDPELGRDNAARRRASRWGTASTPAADRSGTGARGHRVPVLPGDDDGNWRGHSGRVLTSSRRSSA